MNKNYTVAFVTAEMMITEIPGFFRGGLGDWAGHVPEGAVKRGLRIIPITIGYSRHWQTGQPIDYGNVPGAHYLFDLEVDIHFHRKYIPIFCIDRGGAQTFLINDPNSGILYPNTDEEGLMQAAMFGRAVQALLKRLNEKPEIIWYQEWRAACTAMPSIMDDLYFPTSTKHLYTMHTSIRDALPTFPGSWFDGLSIDRRYYPYFSVNGSGRIDPNRGCVRLANLVNGVSLEHGEVLRSTFPDEATKIFGILNGVSRDYMLSNRLKRFPDPSRFQLWTAHQEDKRDLVNYVNGNIGVSWAVDDFVVALWRRLAKYKNQLPMFKDIVHSLTAMGVKILIGGVAHENDSECRQWMEEFRRWMQNPRLKESFVYIDEYSSELRRMAVQGCDVWVECPWKRAEACGTGIFGAWINGNFVIATKGGGAKEHGTEADLETAEGDTLFIEPYEPGILELQIRKAYSLYDRIKHGDERWLKVRKNCFEGGKNLDVTNMIERYENCCFERLLAQ